MEPQEVSNIKSRLLALASTFAESGAMKGYAPIIDKVFGVFISKMSDDDIRDGLIKFRDEVIPWLLYEPQIISAETETRREVEVTSGADGIGNNN